MNITVTKHFPLMNTKHIYDLRLYISMRYSNICQQIKNILLGNYIYVRVYDLGISNYFIDKSHLLSVLINILRYQLNMYTYSP